MYNNFRLITDFRNNPIKVGGSTSEGISPERETVKIRLAMEDRREDLILKLQNVFYFPNNSSNLVSLGLLNNAGIY